MEYKWGGAHGLWLETNLEARVRAKSLRELRQFFAENADPMPNVNELAAGIPHHNDSSMHQGVKWPVARAIHSTKMHYYARLRRRMQEGTYMKFQEAFPDVSPAFGGMRRLQHENWERLNQEFNLTDRADYVKHILTKHDGEARVIGEPWWTDLDVEVHGEQVIRRACCWHYQFANGKETRTWLYERSQESWCDVDPTEKRSIGYCRNKKAMRLYFDIVLTQPRAGSSGALERANTLLSLSYSLMGETA